MLKETEPGKLKVVGTGFYLTCYGLFVSAGHVLEDLVDRENNKVATANICHSEPEEVHLRQILRISVFNELDIGIGQADHYADRFPDTRRSTCARR